MTAGLPASDTGMVFTFSSSKFGEPRTCASLNPSRRPRLSGRTGEHNPKYAGSVRAPMRGPYSEYAAPPVYVYPDRPKPGVRFSRTELGQLAVAILALSGAFTVLFIRSELTSFLLNPGLFLAIVFPASLLAVGTGVGLHEVMHKVVAQRYGLWAEFRYNLRGLLLDRKSTRLNSSHSQISYAVFCLKKKKKSTTLIWTNNSHSVSDSTQR